MTSREQRRGMVLTKLLVGEVTVAEAAELLGISERQVWRLKAAFERAGPAALVHGNRGRPSPRRIDEATRRRVVALATSTYLEVNDCHLVELLAEREDIAIGRVTLRRILRAAGRASPRRRRPPRHRSRRDRMPQAGLLVQTDGSRHDWLGGNGPRLTLIAAIDDATGLVTAGTFRDQEDTAGYLEVLRATIRRHGVPVALYRDRQGIFENPDRGHLTLEEELLDRRVPTQLGRALEELGITSIAARSPQAKGRIERLWGTLQDRLVVELRLAGARDRTAANRLLPRFLARHNRSFAVPPLDARSAWRPRPPSAELERVCCLKYRRVVANDHTVRAGSTILQLPPGPGRRGYAGKRVEVHLRLDGRLAVWDGERFLLIAAAPADPVQVRALETARPAIGTPIPSAAYRPAVEHPWRRVDRGSKLYQQRLTGSPTR